MQKIPRFVLGIVGCMVASRGAISSSTFDNMTCTGEAKIVKSTGLEAWAPLSVKLNPASVVFSNSNGDVAFILSSSSGIFSFRTLFDGRGIRRPKQDLSIEMHSHDRLPALQEIDIKIAGSFYQEFLSIHPDLTHLDGVLVNEWGHHNPIVISLRCSKPDEGSMVNLEQRVFPEYKGYECLDSQYKTLKNVEISTPSFLGDFYRFDHRADGGMVHRFYQTSKGEHVMEFAKVEPRDSEDFSLEEFNSWPLEEYLDKHRMVGSTFAAMVRIKLAESSPQIRRFVAHSEASPFGRNISCSERD